MNDFEKENLIEELQAIRRAVNNLDGWMIVIVILLSMIAANGCVPLFK